jgi:hypothetical protein
LKSKIRGFLILAAVIAAALVYYYVQGRKVPVTVISGYLGGEKVGLLEDEEVQDILLRKYNLQIEYSRAGSLDMVDADLEGRDYLFPSSQVALELYRSRYGNPVRSEILFNTPIVMYTRTEVANALEANGYLSDLGNGARSVDLKKLAQAILDGTTWKDIGLTDYYGALTVTSTDPTRSNSGNMYAGLLANVLSESGTAAEENVSLVIPDLVKIFSKSGYMQSSSGVLFSQFLETGAEPIIVGYESQLLEFAAENPDDWAKLRDDVVMLYPTPTVWSSHPFIALDDAGAKAIDALQDADIQNLAWSRHGFRTGVSGASADISQFDVDGLQSSLKNVIQMPDYPTMEKIIAGLQ